VGSGRYDRSRRLPRHRDQLERRLERVGIASVHASACEPPSRAVATFSHSYAVATPE
jgi:hypothetical protein